MSYARSGRSMTIDDLEQDLQKATDSELRLAVGAAIAIEQLPHLFSAESRVRAKAHRVIAARQLAMRDDARLCAQGGRWREPCRKMS